MKILCTGGHPSPAFAVIEYAQIQYPAIEWVFVGRSVAVTHTQQPALEQTTAESLGIPFIPIQAGRSYTPGKVATLHEWWKILTSLPAALSIVRKVRPTIILSFGSYVAVPITIAAKLLSIPIITHEQTVQAGKSNRLIAQYAQKIAISHPSSAQYFPPAKTIHTGLPLRLTFFTPQPMPTWITQSPTRPLLLVMGGSTGSRFINTLVLSLLPELLEKWTVIHQTGTQSGVEQWLDQALQKKSTLPKLASLQYWPVASLKSAELAWAYQHASAAITRAGANTVAEITCFSIPTILIPLPSSAGGEQAANALTASSEGHKVQILQQESCQLITVLQTLASLTTAHQFVNKAHIPSHSTSPHQAVLQLLINHADSHETDKNKRY